MGNSLKSVFFSVVENEIGSERTCNDGSSEFGPFIVDGSMVDGISDNLSTWAEEKFEIDEISFEDAEKYFDELYPEI